MLPHLFHIWSGKCLIKFSLRQEAIKAGDRKWFTPLMHQGGQKSRVQIKLCCTGCSAAARRSETAKLTREGELRCIESGQKCDIAPPRSARCWGYKYQQAAVEAGVRRLRSLSRPSVPEGFCLAVVSLRCHAGARVKFYINHAISRRRAHAGGRGARLWTWASRSRSRSSLDLPNKKRRLSPLTWYSVA